MTEPKKPFVVPSTTRRDTIVAVLVGGIILGLILFGVSKMGGRVAGLNLTGTITKKTFVPFKEEQVTFGKKKMNALKIDGEYEFEVMVNGTLYIVPVHKGVYEAKKEGESFTFPKPPP